jgi:hypothetical protein
LRLDCGFHRKFWLEGGGRTPDHDGLVVASSGVSPNDTGGVFDELVSESGQRARVLTRDVIVSDD